MIRFQNVYKRYPDGGDALRGISFELERGEQVYLTGHSGAGKSTLLKLVTLVERATRGNVFFADQNLSDIRGRQIAAHRRRIGVVYQDHKLLTEKTVFDNVALPMIVAGMPYREIGRRVRAALDTVGLLEKENSVPLALSGGEQQRVGIARAIINRPELLLADEPTGNLDPELADEIMALFARLNQLNVTVLIATHDPRHFARGDVRVLELREGLLVSGGVDHEAQAL